MSHKPLPVPVDELIYVVRDQRVLLDSDLAKLYGVTTGNLNKAVGRNQERFPQDFMFQLSNQELTDLKFQFGTSRSWGGRRRSRPYAFTQEGVAMLSSVLQSPQAVQVNIQIMRAFVRLRELAVTHKELARRLKQLEGKVGKHDGQIATIIQAIEALIAQPKKTKRQIGFTAINRHA